MAWNRLENSTPPVGRALLVRTDETAEPVVAFLASDGVWYAGGALVQASATVLGATPREWCEPDGDAAL